MVKLTIQQVRQRATNKSFERGDDYYRDDAIFDMVLRGNQIEGYCQGSEITPYHVKAVFNEHGVESTSCTCLYEYGGDCKHIVALLLTYVNNPEAFAQRPSIKQELANRSKEQLIALIELMVERYPDLQDILDRPIPNAASSGKPVSTETFRKQLRKALKRYNDYDDYHKSDAADTITSIAQAARAFSKSGDWHSASAIYKAVCEECIANGEDFSNHDYDGDLSLALDEVLAELAKCAEHFADDNERQIIFKRMLDVTLWDSIDRGGTDLGADVPDHILRYVKPQDIPAIREHLQAAQKRGQRTHYYDPFDSFADFLADLDLLDNIEPDTILQRLRDEQRYELLFDKLISFKRMDEAVKVVEEYLLHSFQQMHGLETLAEIGRDNDAVRLAQASLNKQYSENTVFWLLERYRVREEHDAYFQLQLLRMEHSPDPRYYKELKEAALKLGNWEITRPTVLQQIKKAQRFDVLTRIYLLDEEWDAAWESLNYNATTKSTWQWQPTVLDIEVAIASTKARPEKAIPVLIKHVRQQINQRTRNNYQQAAVYLTLVRDAYRQIGGDQTWNTLISGIREEFRKLPALQDELRQARL